MPTTFWYGSEFLFPDRYVVELDDGRILDVLERRVVAEDYLLFQYMSDVSLSEPAAVERRARDILAVYAGPEADAESCTRIELLATEWCDNGLCQWRAQEFVAVRNDSGDWYLLE